MPTDELDAFARLYLNHGLLSTWDGAVTMLAGSGVGGGTLVNWMTTIEAPASVRREWATEHGLDGLDDGDAWSDDVAVLEDEMAVSETALVPPKDQLILRGAAALGWEAAPDPARLGRLRRLRELRLRLRPGHQAFGHPRPPRLGVRSGRPGGAAGAGHPRAPRRRPGGRGGRPCPGPGPSDRRAHPGRGRTRRGPGPPAGRARPPGRARRRRAAHAGGPAGVRAWSIRPSARTCASIRSAACWPGPPCPSRCGGGRCRARARCSSSRATRRGAATSWSRRPGHPGLVALASPWEGTDAHATLMAGLPFLAPLLAVTRDGGEGRTSLTRAGRVRIDYTPGRGRRGHPAPCAGHRGAHRPGGRGR